MYENNRDMKQYATQDPSLTQRTTLYSKNGMGSYIRNLDRANPQNSKEGYMSVEDFEDEKQDTVIIQPSKRLDRNEILIKRSPITTGNVTQNPSYQNSGLVSPADFISEANAGADIPH